MNNPWVSQRLHTSSLMAPSLWAKSQAEQCDFQDGLCHMLNLDPFSVPLSLNIANKGREIGRRKREIQREREQALVSNTRTTNLNCTVV